MKLLLDTCALLWIATADRALSRAAREAFTDPIVAFATGRGDTSARFGDLTIPPRYGAMISTDGKYVR